AAAAAEGGAGGGEHAGGDVHLAERIGDQRVGEEFRLCRLDLLERLDVAELDHPLVIAERGERGGDALIFGEDLRGEELRRLDRAGLGWRGGLGRFGLGRRRRGGRRQVGRAEQFDLDGPRRQRRRDRAAQRQQRHERQQ